ncbi:MAG: hypothetical protein ACRC28_07250 [Clostridium sp.]|uniref:hypothetical protein n=1 Tax=Clostridium sp. TaxID=1506 RepID=UPI003F2EE91C
MGDIILTRPGSHMLRLLDYTVYVNDEKVTLISDDARKVLNLKEGTHKIFIKVLGAKSNILNINIEKNKTVRLTCEVGLSGFRGLFSYFHIFSKKLLKLDYTII